MPKMRKIQREPDGLNYYLVDANFLANRYIPASKAKNPADTRRILRSLEWWTEIDRQVSRRKAVVYVPDICIAEAFKVLAKKYYQEKCFATPVAYKNARDRFGRDIHIPTKELKAAERHIKIHDISTSRDIIIALDRFFEIFFKQKLMVSVPDLILLATAKYLIDFYYFDPKSLFIVTLDTSLWRGTKLTSDIPSAFNPDADSELASKVFV